MTVGPLGILERVARLEEVAAAVLFLEKRDSVYCTGAAIACNGVWNLLT